MPAWEGMGLAAPGFSLVRASLELRIKIRRQFRLAGAVPGGSDHKEAACNVETRVHSLGQEDPLEEGMATCSSMLARKFHGQRSLAGYSQSLG